MYKRQADLEQPVKIQDKLACHADKQQLYVQVTTLEQLRTTICSSVVRGIYVNIDLAANPTYQDVYKRQDEDAVYDEEYTIDLSTLRPTIAFPHLPENTRTIDEIKEDIKIDQVVIGSCTNGRIDDLRIAAKVLEKDVYKRQRQAFSSI